MIGAIRRIATAGLFIGLAAAALAPAAATGTAVIQQSDGSVKTYANVRIRIADQTLWITSADGKGTIVLGKAACTKVGELVRCYPYDATLVQNGGTMHVALQHGTVWFNPTQSPQPLEHSSARIPPHGVVLSVESQRGTYVSLTGTVDAVQR